jgi:hypothetical protein
MPASQAAATGNELAVAAHVEVDIARGDKEGHHNGRRYVPGRTERYVRRSMLAGRPRKPFINSNTVLISFNAEAAVVSARRLRSARRRVISDAGGWGSTTGQIKIIY